jgi:hypothetical protein
VVLIDVGVIIHHKWKIADESVLFLLN